jgi:hypothetical protein
MFAEDASTPAQNGEAVGVKWTPPRRERRPQTSSSKISPSPPPWHEHSERVVVGILTRHRHCRGRMCRRHEAYLRPNHCWGAQLDQWCCRRRPHTRSKDRPTVGATPGEPRPRRCHRRRPHTVEAAPSEVRPGEN